MWNRQYVIGLSKFEYCGLLFIVIVDMNVYSVIVYFKWTEKFNWRDRDHKIKH